MNLLEVKTKGRVFSINVERKKILLCLNQQLIYQLQIALKHIFEKEEISEFEEESMQQNSIYWNNQKIEQKRWSYYFLSPWFDINDDFKLGAKSLTLNYLESCIREIEYNDAFNMVNQSIISLNDEYTVDSTTVEIDNLQFFGKIKELNLKSILKLIEVKLLLDETESKDFDLSLNSKMLFLLKMCINIAKKNPEKNFCIFIEWHNLDQSNYSRLDEKIPQNMCILFYSTTLTGSYDYSDVILVNQDFIDLNDSGQRYEKLIQDYGICEDPIVLIEMLQTLFLDTKKYMTDMNQLLQKV